jgi:hypothetical protein
MKPTLLLPPICLLALAGAPAQERAAAPQDEDARAALVASLAEHGIRVDLERGIVSFGARVLIREDLLEYVLVGPRGQMHESLFFTETDPALLNTALLALGLEPGSNARWEPREPPPTPEEQARGEPPFDLLLPEGAGLYLYAAWREGEESYFYRVEDLISNLATGRCLRRHRWVYLGSRFQVLKEGEPASFLASVEGNLINLSLFFQGNTLLTAALPECIEQTIWVANAFLLPPRESPVELLLSRERLDHLPSPWQERVPVVEAAEGDGR